MEQAEKLEFEDWADESKCKACWCPEHTTHALKENLGEGSHKES